MARPLVLSLFGTAALAAVISSDTAIAEVGAIQQKAGTAGCITLDGTSGQCATGRAMSEPSVVVVSPDGRHVYGGYGEGIQSFARNVGTGALSALTGTAGCIISDTAVPGCAVDARVFFITKLAISPDGKSVYSSGGGIGPVVIYDRNATTGALTPKSQCLAVVGSTGCTELTPPLQKPASMVLSPGGTNLYIADSTASVVHIFSRASDGTLTPLVGASRCIQDTATNGCTGAGIGLRPVSIAISSDGKSVYVASRDSGAGRVTIFDRAANGVLTKKPGVAGCVSSEGVAGCAAAKAIASPGALSISADGKTVYVGSQGSSAIGIFTRAANGTISQKPGTLGCISSTGTDGLSSTVICGTDSSIGSVRMLAATADGRSLYVTSSSGFKALSRLNRNLTTGELAKPAAPKGCITSDAAATSCTTNQFVKSPDLFALSPNEKSLYLVTASGPTPSGSLLIFDRQTALHTPRIISKPTARTSNTTARFTFSSVDAGVTFQCRIDSKPFATCSSPASYPRLKVSGHTFQVRAVKGAIISEIARYSWKVVAAPK